MIMIRQSSNSTTRMGKPPPPVPPRPSKSIVAEALAKTRKHTPDANPTKPTVPMRTAPPPPKPEAIVKSKSYTSVNVYDNVTAKRSSVARSSSINSDDDDNKKKKNTRTVIFQSSQMKTSKIEVNLTRNDSNNVDRIVPMKRVNSFKATMPCEQLVESRVEVTLKRKESIDKKSKASDTMEDNNASGSVGKTIREDVDNEKSNWNEALNDRNHVNTLIDEMFANVLDNASDSDTAEYNNDIISNNNNNINKKSDLMTDKTQIRIKSESSATSDNRSTVLVIENTADESVDTNATKTASDDDRKTIGAEMETKSASSTGERKEKRVKFDDKMNHELLVAELKNMHRNDKDDEESIQDESPKISRSDWIEVNNGEEVRLSSCQITIDERNGDDTTTIDHPNDVASHRTDDLLCRLNAMSNLQGLPPLPKSLSGFNFLDVQPQTPSSRPTSSSRTTTPGSGHAVYPPHPRSGSLNGAAASVGSSDTKKSATNLDAQLAILRREMYSLRQLDLSLLSQLWSLNESIQDFRQMLQDQEDRVLSPPSPSPTQSSGDDGEGDEYYTPSPLRLRPAPPPPPLRRTSNSSSGTSSV